MVTIKQPVFKPRIDFKIKEQFAEERSTIIHCTMAYSTRIRIWASTFLIQDNGSKKKLLYAYNISEYPVYIQAYSGHSFTLVFEGLDRKCILFDLLEIIPQPGGFHIENIERNKTDVYWLYIESGNCM